MPDLDPASFASVEPAQFASKVKSASKDQLEAVMASEHRGKILDEVFSRFPNQFRADKAGSTNAVIHWNITGRPDGGTDSYEVVIANGTCTVSDKPSAEPKLTITIGGAEFLQLIAGAANPMMMAMTGKLKPKGDLALAANLANLFDLPKS
ncbi:MAG TPA: SCP2 sterol-binding domain-containing protein [Micromonosporaceae bacterium]|nr:SCP2 sterol-binding domain-containing protein [Micromonosporaceae bacterium]